MGSEVRAEQPLPPVSKRAYATSSSSSSSGPGSTGSSGSDGGGGRVVGYNSRISPRMSKQNGIASGGGGGAAVAPGGAVSIGTKPTLVEVKQMRFLIMDAPRQGNLHVYIKEMRKHHVTDIVRVCEPTYHGGELDSAGICLHEMEYKDGTSPSKELIERWLQLVDRTFYQSNPASDPNCIAVHCVAGLGRAPVMVAIAMIEFANMDPVEAVSLIRQKRRGAINEKQLLYLEGYRKQYRRNGVGETSCCVIL